MCGAGVIDESATGDDEQHPTRELTPLEIEDLVEAERRYKPEPGELLDESYSAATPDRNGDAHDASVPVVRARKRTVRMRVFNFKPLPRPPQ